MKKCNNCGEYKVQRISTFVMMMGFVMFAGGFVGSFILIGIPVLIFSPFVLLAGIIMRFTPLDKFKCQKCNRVYTTRQARGLK